jgi:hypothetical protein
LQERKSDLQEISELLKASSHATITEVVKKTEDDLARAVKEVEAKVQEVRKEVCARYDSRMDYKVGVEEVQEAFKRMSESFNRKNIEIE